jgi:RNA polymerase sigma-70 factor (ECF subfamily)
MAPQTGDLIPTRASLLNRLKDLQDQSSWQEFFDTYWKLIYGVARKTGMTDAEAQDVVQETMVSVAKHMPRFRYNPAIGSFKAWLLKLTRWRIIDQIRKRPPAALHRPLGDSASGTDTVERVIDPKTNQLDQLWDAEWQKNLLDAAVSNVKRKLDPRKHQIYDFYVNKGWPADKVAEHFQISVSQVHLAKHRITKLIKSEVTRLKKKPAG